MTNKCWCEEPLVTVLLKTPWRDAGVQPVLHCPEHGDLDSRASLEARAKKAEAQRDAAMALLRRIHQPWGHKRADRGDTRPDWFDEVTALLIAHYGKEEAVPNENDLDENFCPECDLLHDGDCETPNP